MRNVEANRIETEKRINKFIYFIPSQQVLNKISINNALLFTKETNKYFHYTSVTSIFVLSVVYSQ